MIPKFRLEYKDKLSNARACKIKTHHGEINTPVFMPVGTQATVKGVHQSELKDEIKSEIILGNTYHLYLRPGIEIIEKAGGIHKFINWDQNILTDSGGYQVYSLSSNRKITEEGVQFKSHIDGSKHFFSPESAIDVQKSIGADIIMAFDECPPYPCDYSYAKNSMNLTHRWLDRCINQFKDTPAKYGYEQIFFPIVQGSTFKDLRKESAHFISSKNCFGNAIGGLSVGEPHDEMYEMTSIVCERLPEDKPRYLMGVGTPSDILGAVKEGIDMFDCVIPTRSGRTGLAFTWEGKINLRNSKYQKDDSPINKDINIRNLNMYSKSYINHLITSNEILASMLLTMNNIVFYQDLMKKIRKAIKNNTFNVFYKKYINVI